MKIERLVMKCSNDNCGKNPDDSPVKIIVNCDGDAACGEKCKKEYEKQKAYFFGVIIRDDKEYNNWMGR
jgi:hypothetical protein